MHGMIWGLKGQRPSWSILGACALIVVAAIVGMFVAYPAAQAGVEVRVASNPRADRVSGGDVLIQIDLPADVTASDIRVSLNGRDVTSNFRTETDALTLTG